VNLPRRVAALVVLALFGSGTSVTATSTSSRMVESERLTVEALIAHVETLHDARFVRNGKEYPPATAGKFLRAKWKDRAGKVRTAEDFIEMVATRSSTTGRAYLIRYRDGRESTTRELLRSELQRIRRRR
jgi:hypothetical protein